MDRNQKVTLVEELKQILQSSEIVIITQNNGLTVSSANKLRRQVRASQGSYRVAKNRLVKIALKDTEYESMTGLMIGPTAVAYSNDPVGIAKALSDFSKVDNKLEIKGGVMNSMFLTPDQINALASLPSLDELRGKIIGLLQAPATKIAAVLQAPATQMVRVVDAYSKKN
ncbi:MAG: 50S ribosomal protein L10 [Alphaproteobacteria bacterium]|nr:50S ribosomal protein L10 [Candidatus Jidaibacter sp.]